MCVCLLGMAVAMTVVESVWCPHHFSVTDAMACQMDDAVVAEPKP